MLDARNNTALHLASRHGHALCMDYLLKNYHLSVTIRNSDGWRPEELAQQKSVEEYWTAFYKDLAKIDETLDTEAGMGVVAAPRKELLEKVPNSQYLKDREYIPQIPMIAMKVNMKDARIVNSLIDVLKTSSFSVKLVCTVTNPDNLYYLLLNMEEATLEEEAQRQKLMVKLADTYNKVEYEVAQKDKFEPLRSKDY